MDAAIIGAVTSDSGYLGFTYISLYTYLPIDPNPTWARGHLDLDPLSAVSPSMPKPLTRTSFLSVLQFFQCLSVSSISTFHHFSELQCFSLPHCSYFFVQFHVSAPTREGEQLPPSRLGKGARGLGEFRRNFRLGFTPSGGQIVKGNSDGRPRIGSVIDSPRTSAV